jgi:hypothetical protein
VKAVVARCEERSSKERFLANQARDRLAEPPRDVGERGGIDERAGTDDVPAKFHRDPCRAGPSSSARLPTESIRGRSMRRARP